MHFSRRILLSSVPLAVLAACSASPSVVSKAATQLSTDVNLISAGLSSVLVALAAVPGVPAATLAKVQGYLTTIQEDAASIAATSAVPAASITQEVSQLVQNFANAVLPVLPNGSAIIGVVQAALSLLPVILTAAGVSGDRAGVTPRYLPDEARAMLAAGVH